MTPQAKRRWMLLGALALGGAALGVIASDTMDENMVFFWTPTQLVENEGDAMGAPVSVRLGGSVKPETQTWDPDAKHLEFVITDGTTEVPVEFEGDLPDMFRDGIGVVVDGYLDDDGVFRSKTLLVKHDNEYQAPEDGEMDPELLEEIKKQAEEAEQGAS